MITEVPTHRFMPPVEAKPASTVILVRDGAGGPEVLLLRRPDRGFAAGAWVFPGGTVDVDDYRLGAPSAEEGARWAALMGVDDPALAWAFVVAAIRETWEETGLMLCGMEGVGEALEMARFRLLRNLEPFSSIVSSLGFRPAPMVYLSRWITPEAEPRRYDTRFFVARAEEGQVVSPAAGEVEEAIWISPRRAIASAEAGGLRLMLPTRHSLGTLAPYRTTGEMLSRLSTEKPLAYLPRMRSTPKGVIIDIHPLDRADEP